MGGERGVAGWMGLCAREDIVGALWRFSSPNECGKIFLSRFICKEAVSVGVGCVGPLIWFWFLGVEEAGLG